MADKTTIGWTGSTWTPIRARRHGQKKAGWHCERVSAGCRGCYAARQNKWIGTGLDYEPRHRKSLSIFLDEKLLTQPLRWRAPRRVFVCSMTDLFASFVKDEWIDRVFAVMALAPWHTFQVLTKRPKRMLAYMLERWQPGEGEPVGEDRFDQVLHEAENILLGGLGEQDRFWTKDERPLSHVQPWPLPNVWLGVSCEDQATADERIPLLLQTPAAKRFVSYEPALGPVLFRRAIDVTRDGVKEGEIVVDHLSGLDWIIVGGESGPGARPFDLAWARSTVEQCKAAGIACFVKQLGARPLLNPGDQIQLIARMMPSDRAALLGDEPRRDPKGADPTEWPADLRVQEFPA